MARHDSRGLALSTVSDRAAALYRDGIDLMLSAWTGTEAALDGAIAEDPDFALAHAARARVHAMKAEVPAARAAIGRAVALADANGDARERSHVNALSLAIHGKSAQALEAVLAHADAWPRDAVVLALPLGAFGLYAFSGMRDHDQARVDLCERHAGRYDDGDWWFLNYRGWSHAENGAVARGRALVERSLEIRRANANAVHGLAHALFEGGEGAAAARLIGDWLPDYDRAGTLHGHISWHGALVALEAGDVAGALALYEGNVTPSVSKAFPLNVLSDAAAFLWRLGAYGHAVPKRLWDEAAAYGAPLYPKAGMAFADVHKALIDAATGDRAAVEARAAALSDMVAAGTLAAGLVVPALCRGVLAFAEGDYAGSVALLEPVMDEVVRVGGSGAQREIFQDTLLVALMRDGQTAKARTLLDRRLHRRPSPRDAGWRAALAE